MESHTTQDMGHFEQGRRTSSPLTSNRDTIAADANCRLIHIDKANQIMCEGSPGNNSSTQRSVTPTRRRPRPPTAQSSGWDAPPPLYPNTSLEWWTPEKVATLKLDDHQVVAAQIALERYVVVATETGQISLFSTLEPTSPKAQVSLNCLYVVQLVVANKDASKANLWALTVDGEVHRLFLEQTKAGVSLRDTGSWNTHRSTGATSIAVEQDARIWISYDSGTLEEWSVPRTGAADKGAMTLLWRGFLEDSIRSISRLGEHSLAITLLTTHSSPSPLVEVLDLRKLSAEYKSFRSKSGQTKLPTTTHVSSYETPSSESIDEGIPLGTHLRFVQQEIPRTLVVNDHRSLPFAAIPSIGTDTALPLCHQRQCGLSLSDGRLVRIQTIGMDAWGVIEGSAFFASYPIIGSGEIPSSKVCEAYWACCLRGGTCYFLPVRKTTSLELSNTPQRIPVVGFPHDVDMDVDSIYVQSFSAGLVKHNDEKLLPVLLYGFAGGILEIFTFQPTHDASSPALHTEPMLQQPIEEIVDRESLDLTVKVFLAMSNSMEHSLLEDPLWSAAFQEWKKCVQSGDQTMEALLEEENSATRKLLIALATM